MARFEVGRCPVEVGRGVLAVEEERGLGADPKRVVQRTNQALKDATDADSFTTLVYATLDIGTGELQAHSGQIEEARRHRAVAACA